MTGPIAIDIVLRENSDFEWDFTLRNLPSCTLIDIDAYGAKLTIASDYEGEEILSVDTDDYIIINTTTDVFQIDIPHTVIAAKKELFRTFGFEGVYDILVWPTKASPTVDPIAIAHGRVTYQRGVGTPS